MRQVQRRQKLADLQARAASAAELVEAGSWEVRQGDVLERLAEIESGTVRLVFADPPYNEGVDYGAGSAVDRLPREQYLAWCREWMAGCARILTDDGSMWVLISEDYADDFGLLLRQTGLHRRRWLVWEEGFGVYFEHNFGRCARHLPYMVRDRSRFVFNGAAVRVPSARQQEYNDRRADPDGRIMPNVLHFSRITDNHPERIPGFPTQLPLDLLRMVVGCASEPGDRVLDPFSGSATTGAACIELGRRFVGIERSAEFVHLSRQRLLTHQAKRTTA
jgi:site-specific DNA-methyltransferase (adenine-specific)